jgi:hypothetical protein
MKRNTSDVDTHVRRSGNVSGMDDEQTKPVPDGSLMCLWCGALIGDINKHDKWHDTYGGGDPEKIGL